MATAQSVSTDASDSNSLVASSTCAASTFGTFAKPYAATSPWNSRPVSPVFGTDVIPTSAYFPVVAAGSYSTQAFEASATDTPVTVKGLVAAGIWDPDTESYRTGVTIPHWPAGVVPATGTDGHAEIVDTTTGIVHSFWKLEKVNGNWIAAQYAWTSLKGRGFGDGAHYMQGARSSGVSTLGGLIRLTEMNDGATMYHHALAMSMTYNGLSKSPTYVFPATSADTDAALSNTGPFPLGSLMMLPPSFDVSKIGSAALRKVALTLQTYGAYAVDRNVGTPFAIYAENGGNYNLMPNGWNNGVANDLQSIRAAMRRVTNASSWVDGNGNSMAALDTNVNILSLRGAWSKLSGSTLGSFDTWQQAITFAATTGSAYDTNVSGRAYSGVTWTAPVQGAAYHLTATTTGGALFRLVLNDWSTGKPVALYTSPSMVNGQSADFVWPNKKGLTVVTQASNNNHGAAGTATATLTRKVTTASATTCP